MCAHIHTYVHGCACAHACMHHSYVHPCFISACKHACNIAHGYICTCIDPYMHPSINACSHVCICTCMCGNVYMHDHACMGIFAPASMHSCMCTHTHMCMHASACAHACMHMYNIHLQAYMCTRMHQHVHSYLHTYSMRNYEDSMKLHGLDAVWKYHHIVSLHY